MKLKEILDQLLRSLILEIDEMEDLLYLVLNLQSIKKLQKVKFILWGILG